MVNAFDIAIIHTVFKIVSVILLFPFTRYIEKLAVATVRGEDKKGDEFTAMLDERLLATPTVAVERARSVAFHMAELSAISLKKAMNTVGNYDGKLAQEIRELEDKVDIYEDVLGSYLVKLSARDMSEADSHEVSMLLHILSDYERLSDYSVNIVGSAEEIKDKNISFSENAKNELATIYMAVNEVLDITNDAFMNNDFDKAYFVEPLEDVISKLKETIKHNHVIRLQRNECSIELDFILADILTTLERAAAHCSNVAGCLIEISHNSLEMHNFTETQKAGEIYDTKVKEYSAKYVVAAK
jgi:phosphate:Na+ symporter